MSVSKSAFPSLRVESKDWSGLTTENHLGALFGEKPEQISKFISRLEYLDLGEDLISYMEQSPVHYLEDDKEFGLQLSKLFSDIPVKKSTLQIPYPIVGYSTGQIPSWVLQGSIYQNQIQPVKCY